MDLSPRLKEHKERVLLVTSRLEKEFDLSWIKISHLFVESMREDGIVATTDGDWQYRAAAIEWNLPAVARITDETLEEVAIHEYVHVLLNPMEELLPQKGEASKMNEFAVESITRMVQASRKYPR